LNKIRIVTILSIIFLALGTASLVYAASLQLESPTYDYTKPALTISATIENSEDGSTWNTVGISGSGTNWFCRVKTTAVGYSGSAVISWQLQKSINQGSTWSAVSGATVSTTSAIFDGTSGQYVYATPTGVVDGNTNWATYFDVTAQYKVVVDITY